MTRLLLCCALLTGCQTFQLEGVDVATSYQTYSYERFDAWPPVSLRSHGANVGVVLRFERKPKAPVCCWRPVREEVPEK